MQDITLTDSFKSLLANFAPKFQLQSYRNFVVLAAGWILTTGRHTVTGVIHTVKGHEGKHFSAFHAFFNQAKWSLDALGQVMFTLCIPWVADGRKIPLLGDDTLARKKGDHIAGTGMHHDPLLSTTKRVFLHFGHNWVILALVLQFPFIPNKSFAIPLLAWLYRTKKDCEARGVAYRTHTEMMRDMVAMVAAWAPDRFFEFTGDSAYGCATVVKALPANVECVGRLRMDAALYEPAPLRQPGERGRPRKKGKRLPTPKSIAADVNRPWIEITAFLYGKRVTTWVKGIQALWYTTAGERLLSIVIVRDPTGKRHDEAFFSTDLTLSLAEILERFSLRWTVETLFQNSKQYLGFEDPQNRTEQAVERTAPFALLMAGLTILWFAQDWQAAKAFLPEVCPWYPQKAKVGISFADMLTALRRMSLREVILKEADGKPLPRKCLDLVLHLLGRAA